MENTIFVTGVTCVDGTCFTMTLHKCWVDCYEPPICSPCLCLPCRGVQVSMVVSLIKGHLCRRRSWFLPVSLSRSIRNHTTWGLVCSVSLFCLFLQWTSSTHWTFHSSTHCSSYWESRTTHSMSFKDLYSWFFTINNKSVSQIGIELCGLPSFCCKPWPSLCLKVLLYELPAVW